MQPEPADLSPRPLRWAWFLWLNVLSFGIAAAIFIFLYHADFLDSWTSGVAHWFAAHSGISSLIATAPLLVTLLISLEYAKKGMRKRAAARSAAASAAQPQPGPERE
ncbi:MAG: hypothetical protein HYY06_29050 [Deltaproteobacteria bacterium]|nr:hypothetical protein [Deltaproteobacteria bacterium]